MKKPAKTAKHSPKVAHVVIQKNAKLLLKSHNPNMTKVLEKLHANNLDGVSEILSKVRWMSRLQAKSFASFFGRSDFDAINTRTILTLKGRTVGQPPSESTTAEMAAYQRGRLVSQMIARLKAEAQEVGLFNKHVTAKSAVNIVIDEWPEKQSGKPPAHSSLKKDYSYFCKVEESRAGSHFFPPLPELPKHQKKK